MRLQDKVCIITGSADGIGLAAAKKFAAEGAIAIVCDNRSRAARIAPASSGQAHSVTMGLAQAYEIHEVIRQIRPGGRRGSRSRPGRFPAGSS
ncbi:MAG: SDR family NAD(P)-dependent oxidoreductase [Polaromonas sp.]